MSAPRPRIPALCRLALPAVLAFCLAACARPEPLTPQAPAASQTQATQRIAEVAAQLSQGPDHQRVCQAMAWVGENLAYDPLGNHEQFTHAAADLFDSEILGGCSDFALANLALLRAMGFPARLAVSVNAYWIKRHQANPLAFGNGHGFVEVFLDGRWHLADPTGFILYDGYTPGQKNLPGREIFMARGEDFASLGILSVEDANAMLARAAKDNPEALWSDPGLATRCAVKFNFPATFAKLGNIFLAKGRDISARRLCRKAVELDPANVTALVCLARCQERRGELASAQELAAKALALEPDNPEAGALVKSLRP